MRIYGEYLLQGTHSTCIDIDVWVDFDACNTDTDALQEETGTGGDDALPDARYHT